MAYIVAIAVILGWAAMLHKAMPFAAYYVCPALAAYVLYSWTSSYLTRQRETIARTQRRQREFLKALAEFRSLQTKFQTNGTSEITSFESEFDAEMLAEKIGGQHFEFRKQFLVVDRRLTESELNVCRSFLLEMLSPNPDQSLSAITRPSLIAIAESEIAIATRKERIAKLHEERARLKALLLQNVERRTQEDFAESATAVYVFTSSAGCKVGISNDPNKRLRQIQTGHAVPLRIAKVWWFANVEEAAKVEKQAHGLLKVIGVHTSGEWFSAAPREVIEHVRRVIGHLLSRSEIDRALRGFGEEAHVDPDLTLAGLTSLPWKISRKGNEWLQIGGHHIVIFKSRGGYSFSYREKFSDERFQTKTDAKAAALYQHLTST